MVDINTIADKDPIWAPGTVRKVIFISRLRRAGTYLDPCIHAETSTSTKFFPALTRTMSRCQAAYLQLSTMTEFKEVPFNIPDDDIGASVSVHFDTGDWAHVVRNQILTFWSVH